MSARSWISNLFARKSISPIITRRIRRLSIEALEDRAVPATFTVSSLLDDGSDGTLRWAVEQANTTAGADTIDFAPGVAGGTIVLDPARGQLNLTDSATTTIDGGTAGVTIDGNNATRLFWVNAGATAALDRLTLTRGRVVDQNGAGIYNAGTLAVTNTTVRDNAAIGSIGSYDRPGRSAAGGGIYNAGGGTLTLTASTFTGNRAMGGEAPFASSYNGSPGIGGAVYNAVGGTLEVITSHLSDNIAVGGNGSYGYFSAGGSGIGGGIYNAGRSTITATTLSGNKAEGGSGGIGAGEGGGGGSALGGGIYNAGGGVLNVTASTLVGNRANGRNGNGDYYNYTGSAFGGNASGGGIDNNGTLAVAASTFSGNIATAGNGGNGNDGNGNDGGNARGGGISNSGTLTVSSSTFSGNTAAAGSGGTGGRSNGRDGTATGGGIFNDGTASVTSTIVADNIGGNLFGTFTDTPTVESIFSTGSGTPDESVGTSISDDRRSATLVFDQFVASLGSGVPVSENQKDSQVSLLLHAPEGVAVFSITVTQRGYAQLTDGMAGAVRLAVQPLDGRGGRPFAVLGNPNAVVEFTGPTSRDYLAQQTFTVVTDRSNTLVTLNLLVALTNPDGSPAALGQLTLDSLDISIRSDTPATAADWRLDPAGLQDNGGPTQTIALLPGSPAVNRGIATDSATDQRGVDRDTRPDIGAFEFTAFQPSLVVTTLDDEDDGTADPRFGSGTSLREAVAYANANPGADTITFDPTVFDVPRTLTLGNSSIRFTDSARTTIQGPEERLTVFVPSGGRSTGFIVEEDADAGMIDFNVTQSVDGYGSGVLGVIRNDGTLEVDGLTLDGTRIFNDGVMSVTGSKLLNANNKSGLGGALINHGTLEVTDSIIANNFARFGGGIYNTGTLSLTNSTLTGNSARSGGSIYNTGMVTITNSTLSNNSANGGGGLYNDGGTATITSSTIAGNTGFQNTGGIFNSTGTMMLVSTIVADGVQGTLDPASTNNLLVASVEDAGLEVDSDGKPVLRDNGGPTQTIALLPGSLAIGTGLPGIATTDQRGLTRNANPDIGAFETQVPTVTIGVTGGEYDGTARGISAASVTGVNGVAIVALGNPTLSYTYYAGTLTAIQVATATPLPSAPTNAGSYTVVATFTSNVTGYRNAKSAPAYFTITPRVLTVSATASNREYDGSTSAIVSLTFGNAVTGESPTATFTAVFRDKNAGADKPADVTNIALTSSFATNYTLNGTTAVTTTATISPKAISGAFTAANRDYDGSVAATVTVRTLNGVIGLDAVTLSGGTASFTNKNSGVNKTVTLTGATLTGADASNYTLTGVATTTATITPRVLTITATGVNKIYDGSTAATVNLGDNRLTGDQLTVSYTTATFNTADVGANKPVIVTGISLTGTDADNYIVNATATTTASITPASVTVGLTTDRPVAVPGLAVTFTATIGGPGIVAGTVTFRDGSTVLGTSQVINGVARLTTDTLPYGHKTITATFTSGNFATAAKSVGVQLVPAAILFDPLTGQNSLFVGGTSNNDEIEVKRKGNDRYEVEIESGCWEFEQDFTGAVRRVVVYAGAGNDEVDIDGNVRVPVWQFGGAGNDELRGAENAPNVLVGGTGNDTLKAGNARDILIGGAGADRLEGKNGDDLLIAGSTAFDQNESLLWGVQLEWTSDRSFAMRVANLRGTGTGPRANGTAFLIASGPSRTVFDDGSADYLKGGGGRDWYFANTSGGGVLDTVAGLRGDDLLDEL